MGLYDGRYLILFDIDFQCIPFCASVIALHVCNGLLWKNVKLRISWSLTNNHFEMSMYSAENCPCEDIHYVFVWRFFFNIYIYIAMSVTLPLVIHIPSINPARQTFSERIGAMYKRWRSLQGALVLERPWALIHLQQSGWLQIMSRMSMIFKRVSFGGHAFCCCIIGNWCCI